MNIRDILKEAGKKSLKATATVVRGRNGKIRVERGELLSRQEKVERVAVSERAGKLRKGLPKQEADRTPSAHQWPIPSGHFVEFDSSKSSWVPWTANADASLGELGGAAPTTIRVVTYNVWFSEFQWQARLQELIKLVVAKEVADVVCLQEVTPRFLSRMLQYPSIQQRYRVVGGFQAWYGVCMLVSRSLPWLPQVQVLPLPTKMGRSALITGFQTTKSTPPGDDSDKSAEPAAGELAIATVHLESLNSKQLRSEQMSLIRQALAGYDSALLVGDMNITATGPWKDAEEHQQVLSTHMTGFADLWTREHGTDADEEGSPLLSSGTTYDTKLNGMLGASKRFEERGLLDRAFIRESPIWRGQNIEIIGSYPIPPAESKAKAAKPVFISDHFGLVLDLICEK